MPETCSLAEQHMLRTAGTTIEVAGASLLVEAQESSKIMRRIRLRTKTCHKEQSVYQINKTYSLTYNK